MKEKYYVPNITEFHIGFEYEQEDINEGGSSLSWYKHSIEKGNDIDQLEKYEEHGLSYRVKYLDREDIESLGFEFKTTSYGYYYTKGNYKINYDYANKLQIIEYSEEFGMDMTLFRGDIKNKSKLKEILKMTGVWKRK